MRPKIICHMVSSIDGRLQTDYYSKTKEPLDVPELLRIYHDVGHKFHADGFIMGRATTEEMLGKSIKMPAVIDISVKADEDFYVARDGSPLMIVVDRHGKVHYPSNKIEGAQVVTIIAQGADSDYLASLQQLGVSYIFAGADGNDINLALQKIKRYFNVRSLLLEGGAVLNGGFYGADAIDAYSIMVYPALYGKSGAPAIMEYMGDDIAKINQSFYLQLSHVEQIERDFVWLCYDVIRDQKPQ